MSNIHPNYIKASNITLVSILIGLVNLFLIRDKLINTQAIGSVIFTFIVLLLLAFLIRHGYAWMKYVLLIFTLLGAFAIPIYISDLLNNTLLGILETTQTILQIWVVVILFKIPKIIIPDSQPDL